MARSLKRHAALSSETIDIIGLNLHFQNWRAALYFAELTQKCDGIQLAPTVNDPRIYKHVRLAIVLRYTVRDNGIETLFVIVYIKLDSVIDLQQAVAVILCKAYFVAELVQGHKFHHVKVFL